MPKRLSRSKMKWWAIYTNLPVNAILKLPHTHSRYSQSQEAFLESSAEKQTCNYGTECSNLDPFLSILRSKGLSHIKMKSWAIYLNLPVNAIVRLSHPQNRDSECQEMFLAPFGDRQTRNYDTECSKHHPFLSTQMTKWLRGKKIKWWTIYRNLLVKAIVRLPHPQSGDFQNQEKFLAPSADKQIGNFDTQCLNHHPSLETLGLKRLSRSKMKWWAIYTNIPVNARVRLPYI